MLALDGRWSFDANSVTAYLTSSGVPAPVGGLVFGEARANRVLDFVGVDARAAEALELALPERGEAFVHAALGIQEGETLDLRSHAWPTPYVATFFEMERTPRCDQRTESRLCFLPELEPNEARLRLRAAVDARDAAFLPDLVELGPGGRPAYWNGTFRAPDGTETPFTARALINETPVPAEFDGPMAPGEWVISFRLEANGRLAGAGAAGIVRIREPGYAWFDDRLQQVSTPDGQARAVIANATPTRAEVRVTRVLNASPFGNDIVVLSMADARSLAGTTGVTALLVNLTPTHERAIEGARGSDALTLALRTRGLPLTPTAPTAAGPAILFAADRDVDVDALPRIAGAGPPSLALTGRPPIGEPTRIDGKLDERPLLLLAHAEGPVPWGLPAGGRWETAADANDNLSRSRTLALGSNDITSAALATLRIELGAGNSTRTVVVIGGVTRGPSAAMWTSAALVAGSGAPVNPRVILPLEAGADRAEVERRAVEAWAPFGLAIDR